MLEPPPDERILHLWRGLACAPHALTAPGVTVVSDDAARVTRPGWCGVVAIGGSGIVTTPARRPAALDQLLGSSPTPEMLTDPARVTDVIGPLQDVLGPADLQYGGGAVTPLQRALSVPSTSTDPLVQEALQLMPAADRSEAGFEDESIGAVFVAMGGDQPAAVAGYRVWEGIAAHIGVVTSPTARRRGPRRVAAEAASAYGPRIGA